MRIQNPKNRQGLTLIFVVSMIVLFLLMGTTFVVISNDYFRAARIRSQAELHTIDRNALVHRSLFNLVRGPDLLDSNSPLRGHDLLSDQYGYGFKATVAFAQPLKTAVNGSGQLINNQLISIELATQSSDFRPPAQLALDNGRQILGLRDMLRDASAESYGSTTPHDLSGVVYHSGDGVWRDPDHTSFAGNNQYKDFLLGLDTPGYFNGQILTFTTGDAKRTSARIVDYVVHEDTRTSPSTMFRRFVILPERIPAGGVNPFDTPGEINNLGEVRDGSGFLTNRPSTIIINGKPFSGFGAGLDVTVTPAAINPAVALRANNARYQLGGFNYENNPGSTRWDLDPMAPIADPFFARYSMIRNAVNEPWDTYDHDNVFLAQNLPSGPVASFNPIQMSPKHTNINDSDPNAMPTPLVVQDNVYSFRPVYQWDPDYQINPANPRVLESSTANVNFPNLWDESVPIASRPTAYQQLGIPHEMQTRPLDVDNDQDGVYDSVWIDVGHGIITTPDGRRIKPLVAAMIIDLDSRLNVNAHGTLANATSLALTNIANKVGTYTPGYMGYFDMIGMDSTFEGSTDAGWNVARGLGMGPAEISLLPLVDPASASPYDYRPLLIGSTNTAFNTYPQIPGRYGYDRLPGNTIFDNQARWRFLDYPYPGTVGGSFQSRPMDIQGRFVTGFPQSFKSYSIEDRLNPGTFINVDVPYGSPLVDIVSSSWPPAGPDSATAVPPYPSTPVEIYNSPYEVSLVHEARSGDDLLYTPDELEAVLRPYDVDSQMINSRLKLFGLGNSDRRHLVTTDSWEVPTLPPSIFNRNGGQVNQTIPERLYDILSRSFGPGVDITSFGATPGTQNYVFTHMRGGRYIPPSGPIQDVHSLLAPEVLRGLPMNVNRIFGNGRDDNGNNIVDEHWNSNDVNANESLTETYPLNPAVNMDHNNDGFSNFQDRFSRQIFARHLFVLTWLVTGGDFDATVVPSSTNPAPPDLDQSGDVTPDDYALLAQWCINVVDFRDADSICTPFKYDKNPWDGWDETPELLTSDPDAYDGTVANPNGVVWGLERPELLLTEALATHERRYEDRNSDTIYESHMAPKASVFIEIYNPWSNVIDEHPPGAATVTTFDHKSPAEFYDFAGVNNGFVDLAKFTTGPNSDPVWRMAFTDLRGDDATDTNARRVYFTEPAATILTGTDAPENGTAGTYYYSSIFARDVDGDSNLDTNERPVIGPNGYAVIGSSGVARAAGEYRTSYGRRTDLGPNPVMDLKLDETRSMTLIPGNGATIPRDTIELVDGTDGTMMNTETRNVTVVPVDMLGGAAPIPRSLGISDPNAGYAGTTEIDPNMDGDPTDGDGWNMPGTPPPTVVADDLSDARFSAIANEGLTHGYRYVKLQRLANPLVDHHPQFNPYITVDVSPVDLLSFNGLADTDADVTGTPGTIAFDTHERGEMMHSFSKTTGNWTTTVWDRATAAIADYERYLWPEENVRDGMVDAAKATADQHFFPLEFTETYGDLNDTYRGLDATVNEKPYMWMTWNNRPYVSQYELMNVPTYRSLELLTNFDPNASQVMKVNDTKFKRIFDFLDVPSRYVNMEIGFDPVAFNGESPSITENSSGQTWIDNPTVFNAPNNYASRYRYPGKINVNTLTSNQVSIWDTALFPNWGLPASNLAGARGDFVLDNTTEDLGGYGSTSFGPPTVIVTNPIRPDGVAANDSPMLSDMPSPINGVLARDRLSSGESDGSILRRLQDPAVNRDFYRTSILPHEDTTNNYGFSNSAISKMANTTTDRSSVFAVWITVGYFEVDDQGRLGAEDGSDTGEIIRNRGFYIFDRSIPVGFEPGKNHNIERAILVQSIIE